MESVNTFLSQFFDENGNLTPLYRQEGWEIPPADSIFAATLTYKLLFSFAMCLFETYLHHLQYVAYRERGFPKRIKKIVRKIDAKSASGARNLLLPRFEKTFKISQAYGVDRMRFLMAAQLFGFMEGVVYMLSGFLPYMWDLSSSIYDSDESGTTLVFIGIILVIYYILYLPFDIYSTFQIEKKHGFNKATIGLFFKERVIVAFVVTLIFCPILVLMMKVIKYAGDQFYVYIWVLMVILTIFKTTLATPIFSKREPLGEGDLRDSIFKLAESTSYPLTNVYVMDGNVRPSHSYAFMFGFGSNKRIALYDSLMSQYSDDEILGMLGHEFGHWKLGHKMINFVITNTFTGLSCYAFSLCVNSSDLCSAFGFAGDKTPTLIALLLFFDSSWAPVLNVCSFLLTMNSRRMEFEADKFGFDLGMGQHMKTALTKHYSMQKTGITRNKLYTMYHYSHPLFDERLYALTKYEKKRN